MNTFCFLFFFYSFLGFCQHLEEDIYVATETFIANKNEATLKRLSEQENEFNNKVNTKDEQLALVFLQCNKGYYLRDTGHLIEAITTFEDASKRFFGYKLASLSDFDITESCLKPLGNLYTQTGDFTNAISTINRYIFLAREHRNRHHQISGTINLAKLYQTLGKHELAIEVTREFLESKSISKSQLQKLTDIYTESRIVLGHISGHSKSPEILDNKSRYKIELEQGNYKSAYHYFKKAKTEQSKTKTLQNRSLAKLYVEEAQLQYLLKKKTDALITLNKAIKVLIPHFDQTHLPQPGDLYPENTFIDIFELYAALQTDPEQALKSLDLSFYVSDLLRNNWTSQENKIQQQASDRLRSEICIDLLFDQYQNTQDTQYLIKAFQYAENNKASVLKEIAQKKLLLSTHPNDSLLLKEFKLLTEQERLTSVLIQKQLSHSLADKINTISQQLTRISQDLKRLRPEILKAYPNTGSKSISVEHLQQKLKTDDATLIEFFYGEKTIYQFVISKANININRIPLNEFTNKSITDYIHLFDNASVINNNISNFKKQAYELYKLLKIDTVKNQDNIIIVPDGLLSFVPFESLLTNPIQTSLFTKMPFLVKQHTVAYNSSAQFYLTEKFNNTTNKLLGVFPVFENSKQPLLFSINEAQMINKLTNAEILLKDKATKAQFFKKAKYYNTLHLSTHASSGDFVTPAHIEFYSSTLFLNELYSLNLNTNLVVLSACETGIGHVYKGEGPMSIARGFQYAGANNLLFSLWQINDLSTSQLMQSFYGHYKVTNSINQANHQSKLDYLNTPTLSNAKKSPYYWSAFVFYGTPTKPSPNHLLFYAFISIAITLIIVFLGIKLKIHARDP